MREPESRHMPSVVRFGLVAAIVVAPLLASSIDIRLGLGVLTAVLGLSAWLSMTAADEAPPDRAGTIRLLGWMLGAMGVLTLALLVVLIAGS